jgi:hypothetical protein
MPSITSGRRIGSPKYEQAACRLVGPQVVQSGSCSIATGSSTSMRGNKCRSAGRQSRTGAVRARAALLGAAAIVASPTSAEPGPMLWSDGEDAIDLSVGREVYELGSGFLLWDGATDGGKRGGCWLDMRRAARSTRSRSPPTRSSTTTPRGAACATSPSARSRWRYAERA